MNILPKLWFWLTVSNDCGWCKRRLHQAWIPLRHFNLGGVKVKRVSHGMCPTCFTNWTGGVKS